MCEGSDCPEHGEELCNVASYAWDGAQTSLSGESIACIVYEGDPIVLEAPVIAKDATLSGSMVYYEVTITLPDQP